MFKKLVLILITINITMAFCKEIDDIVAKVGSEIILKSELEEQKATMRAAGISGDDITDYDVLNSMIEDKIIFKIVEEEEYEIDEYAVRQLAKQEISRIAAQFESEYQFEQQLKNETGLSKQELEDYYFDRIKEQRLKQQVINEKIKNRINITEVEIKEYYEDHKDEFPKRPSVDKIGFIKKEIKPSKETKKEIIKEINRIRDQVLKGEDFSELAKKFSDSPTGKNGGNLGFLYKGQMVEPFEEAAFSLRKGQISDIVGTDNGFHIIKLIDKEEDKVKVQHIFKELKPTESDIKKIEEMMDNIKERLENGEDFFQVAREVTKGDSLTKNAGVLGEFPPENYPEICKDLLTKIDYGEYTPVKKIDDFYYIFAKLEKIPERPYVYDEMYEKVRNIIQQNKEKEMYEEWMEELTKKTYIEILL